ncbi:MAG: DoxX family protein [Rhodobacteraceae bacterium]|jgi:uncharacterized membrane protein YphA (DoxX/SURF4 family)|nr:DoxX family protein [Paracoccaceae bacterium]
MSGPELAWDLARVLSCGIWVGAGLWKLTHFRLFTAKMAHLGFPLPAAAAAAVIATELAGTALLVLGLWVTGVALVWMAFTLWATWLEHRRILAADGTLLFPEFVQVCKNASILGGLVMLVLLDPARPAWLWPAP